jgi:signal transduction histidine kinase
MGLRGGTAPPARLLVALGVLAAGLGGLGWWLWLDYGRAPWHEVLSVTAASGCFVVAGMVAWRLRPRSRIGLWMVAMGFAAALDELNSGLRLSAEMPGRELTVLAGVPATWLRAAIGAHLLLSYPTGRLGRGVERRVVAAGFLVASVGAALLLVTKTAVPACAGWCGPSPVQLVSSIDLYLGIRSAVIVASVGLAGIVLVLLVRRAVRSTPRQRRVLGFMIAAAGLSVLLFSGAELNVLAMYAGGGSVTGQAVLNLGATWAIVAALPVAFLVGLLQERLAFASVGSLVGRLEQVSTDRIEAALGEVLHDSGLHVVFPAEGGGLIDVSGRPYKPPRDGSRSVTPLGDPPMAVLVHDPELSENRELLDAAAAAARLALDNARLQAEVRAQLAEVRASRQRIAAAADAERQRLERDLHDGAQQRLLGVGLALGVLRGRLAGVERDLVDELERELRAAIGELRELAQGIRPAVLTDQGLPPALARLARRAGVRVALDVRLTERLDPAVEAAAYYVVSEALQNVVKHGGGAGARVSAVHQPGSLVIDVADDGPGGALMRAGAGLHGLADRVEAVGGRFDVHSPAGHGTHIHAELPCA